jgi:hypothetical protein
LKRTLALIILTLAALNAAHAQDARSVAAANKPRHTKSGDPYLPRVKSSTSDKSLKVDVQSDAVDQLIERNEQAEGGAARLLLKSRIIRGRVEMSASPLPGTFEVYEKVPGKKLEVINAPSGQFIHGADGARQWVKSPFDLSVTLPESEGESKEADASGARPAKWKKHFTAASIRGRAFVDGREMVVLAATPKGQKPILMYFDAETWLFRKQVFTSHKPDDDNPLKEVYVDGYAVVDGVKLPSLYRRVYEKYTLTFRVVEVKHNVPIDDALFRDPNGK